MAESTVFQIRADANILRDVKVLAAKRKISANRFMLDAIKAKLAAEKELEWRRGFEAMGQDPDMSAEFMLAAGSEVVLGD